MNSKLNEEYHFLILDLMEIDSSYQWNRILKEVNYDYSVAMGKLHSILIEIVTSYESAMIYNEDAKIELYISDLKWLEDMIERYMET